MMTVSVIAYCDEGSGRHIAEAIASSGKYKVNYVKSTSTPGEYKSAITTADIIIVKGDYLPVRKKGKLYVQKMGSRSFVDKMSGYDIKLTTKIISCPGGSWFRRPIEGYQKSYGSKPLKDYIDNCDYIAPINPDLNYPELNGCYLPFAVDTKNMKNTWKPHSPIIISAYRAQCDCKGVDKYLIPAVNILRSEGHKINLEIGTIRKIPRKKFIAMKSASTVCFGQIAPMGEYGNHELEAMSYGIPTIISDNEQTSKQAYPIKDFAKPLLRANTTEELVSLLRNIINGKINMKKVSDDTFAYVKRVHSRENVAKIFDGIVDTLLSNASIVIAYHNEGAEFINTLLNQIEPAMGNIKHEVIIVDDYSDVPLDIGSARVIRHHVNMGVGAAFDTGVNAAKYDNIILMGADIRLADNGWAQHLIDSINGNPKSIICAQTVVLDGSAKDGMDYDKRRDRGLLAGANLLSFYGRNAAASGKAGIRSILAGQWRPNNKDEKGEIVVPVVMGACYGIKKAWYQHIDGFAGHIKWGSLEPYISLKSWMFGGDCICNKDVEVGHIFNRNPKHGIKQEYIYHNKIWVARVLFDEDIANEMVAYLPRNSNVANGEKLIDKILLDKKRAEYKAKTVISIDELEKLLGVRFSQKASKTKHKPPSKGNAQMPHLARSGKAKSTQRSGSPRQILAPRAKKVYR